MKKEKFYPAAGEKVTLYYPTGRERPFTVDRIEKGRVVLRECLLHFTGPVYWDTEPDYIGTNPAGREITLSWCPSGGYWKEPGRYGASANFGGWAWYNC